MSPKLHNKEDKNMNAFERLSNLVDEIVILCETSEKETQQIRQKTEEYKEHTFFMFCTSLAPYWEMIKKIGRGVTVKTGVKLSEDECKIVFQPCYISIEYRNCNRAYVTRNNNDFYSYNQIANKKLFFDIAKNIDWNIFDII